MEEKKILWLFFLYRGHFVSNKDTNKIVVDTKDVCSRVCIDTHSVYLMKSRVQREKTEYKRFPLLLLFDK